MSRKNNLLSFPIINAVSMTGDTTSSVTDIQFLDDVGIQFTWSGSPVGTFAIQVSADFAKDYSGNITNAGTWAPLTFTYWNGTANVTATSIPTSVGSPIYIDMALLSAPYIRATYTHGSSTGTLTALITAKAV